jgi:cold shock CspA family protein
VRRIPLARIAAEGSTADRWGAEIPLADAGYPKRIFAHRSTFEETEVDEIEIGQQVFFRLRFNRQGPVAVSVHLKPSGWEPSVMDLAEAESELDEVLVE